MVTTILGYTSNERRSSLVLIIIMFLVIGIRTIIPENIVRVDIDNILVDNLYNDEPEFRKSEEESVAEVHNSQDMQGKNRNPITELNSCDSADLEALPGLGPVLSGRVIKFRKLLGGFYSVGQLKEVYGLSEETYEIVSGRVKVDTSLIKKINVTGATYYDLVRLPYLSSYEVNALLSYRSTVDTIGSIGELVDNGIISSETGSVISHYLDFK